ncbi:HD domain-containing protein [Vibrio vulnificus]|uniref:HD-GYP domain-containing protein n=1 Tax=Vibrio vulnificus TaxID=672 RepID=UPI0007354738|nr:two-component system response regulator [Vibrio vulnificus]PNM65030.1 HD domain-containing protein [Vibrio vulnificus]SUQ28541.1 response regulator [Vibrio vulnificus]
MPIENLDDCTVLIVDDSADNLAFMAQGLSSRYHVKAAKSGEMALHILEQFEIDLVLLDIVMPELSGYDVIRKIRANHKTQDIPVVFLTGKDSPEDEKLGFELGAADYIHKPVSIPLLRSRVRTHLQNKLSKDFLRDQNGYLEKEVLKRSHELDRMQDAVVFALASLAETRDPETGNHILRTQHYVRLLAEQLASLPKYQTLLTPKIVDTYFKAAPLHDIGKVGIVDSILLKPGKLTAEEFEEMKSHTTLGLLALEKAEKLSGAQNELISAAKEIAYGHHEKWDGSGYPNGYAGERIPLSARLMAIADVYDALRCKRVYKDPMSHEATRSIILEGNGTHFDPEVIDAFLAQEDMFIKIASEFADE